MAANVLDCGVGGANNGGSGGAAATAPPAGVAVQPFQIDDVYEFSAPRFFDFSNEETVEEIHRAERWFETALSYAQSPFVMGIKGGRSLQPDSLCCDFEDVEEQQQHPTNQNREPEVINDLKENSVVEDERCSGTLRAVVPPLGDSEPRQEEKLNDEEDLTKPISECKTSEEAGRVNSHSSTVPMEKGGGDEVSVSVPVPVLAGTMVTISQASDACTPTNALRVPGRRPGEFALKDQTAKKIASLIRKTSALKPKNQTPSECRISKQKSASRCLGSIGTKKASAVEIAQENQAIKRQKLDGGKVLQIHNVKNRVLMHKSKQGLTSDGDTCTSAAKGRHEDKKEATPFVSMAEMVKRFQTKTREIEILQNRSCSHEEMMTSMLQRRPTILTLTRPKEPELRTSHRVRAVRIKSSAELEEEMLAKIPKFKARPVNKKILEKPSLPAPQRSTPQPPEFQDFHLKTMERANRNAERSSILSSSLDSSSHDHSKLHKLTEPRPPLLETSLRARPSKVKSSQELELEELEKMPKFKARPLNKKIFESTGDLGLFCNPKPQVTTPQDFHFATDERLGASSVGELFDKLSLHPDAHSKPHQLPKMTVPNPFHLQTEERGLDKERHFSLQLLQKELEEERARVPKANPYPYTTDYPVIPPRPATKECTKPEAFQLESLVRHEEAMQRKMEEKEQMEREEAQRRQFKAQPIMNVDPFPIPMKERKPLTEVQGFVLHVDHRATDREEFDKKIKEKETVYKRLRDEYETVKMIEEEKAVKQMRKTMVPYAKPLPNFDHPFLPQKSNKETTKPKSPTLNVAQRVVRRQRCHSSSVSQMR